MVLAFAGDSTMTRCLPVLIARALPAVLPDRGAVSAPAAVAEGAFVEAFGAFDEALAAFCALVVAAAAAADCGVRLGINSLMTLSVATHRPYRPSAPIP